VSRVRAQPGFVRTHWPDILAVVWIIAAALAVLAPALLHGRAIGSYDIVSTSGLTARTGATIHSDYLVDQITQSIPWTVLQWTQVHHGHLPLWNPYSLLGMPLAFNWLSSSFSVPTLVSYLFPLGLAYTVQIVVTLVIAGTGAYVLGRVLGLGRIGSVMAATVFELSGPMLGFLGWPQVQVMSWAGWLVAACIVVIRGRRRAAAIAAFASVVACTIYAGFPEGAAILFVVLGVFGSVYLVLQKAGRRLAKGATWRALRDLAIGLAGGAALGAPLLLPGIQLSKGSIRSVETFAGAGTLPAHSLVDVLFQGFDGLPETGSRLFSHSWLWPLFLQDYIGVLAACLVVTAVATRWRQPAVVALGVAGLLLLVVCYCPPLAFPLQNLGGGHLMWAYAVICMPFPLAVLAGVGADALVAPGRGGARWWMGMCLAASVVLIAGLWCFGRGRLPAGEATIRNASFLWPVIETAVGLGALGALVLSSRRRMARHLRRVRRTMPARWLGLAILGAETAFLVVAGAPAMSSSPGIPAPTPAVRQLRSAVGSAVVGCGDVSCYGGPLILPNYNVVEGVHEFGVYDPATPLAYRRAWQQVTGATGGSDDRIFAPAVPDAATARVFGIGYIVMPAGSPGLPGTTFVEKIGRTSLYRVPGARTATLTAQHPGAPGAPSLPAPTANNAGTASWDVTTDAAVPTLLRLRISAVPGWHATIDGHALSLRTFDSIMLEARIPPGRHTVVLRYWPTAFTFGIAAAVVAALALLLAVQVEALRRRGPVEVFELAGPAAPRTATPETAGPEVASPQPVWIGAGQQPTSIWAEPVGGGWDRQPTRDARRHNGTGADQTPAGSAGGTSGQGRHRG